MQIYNIENIDAILAMFLYLAKSLCSYIEPSNMARGAGISFFTV